ncbi:hypothetical protein HZU40_01160 [Mycolicibacterium fluoranthenivorans]|jgi:hypothetical protein|uniref:Uncharacterized protein n=1 Tax=Mycolicibacterium fluoranthenivorans TaxID=258505 RepID=A0A1G4WS92_9MYCO|nr:MULTISPECIES: hypothetical protein [Mycobacteriaceae]MCV7253750.1 hypothetical protein [Mycobacterium hackensackense]MCV7355314.1 hypothetical protein [Mycolicibacterium fluoranthenivorans]NIH98249.1 hypothetical protein [Mycolicibacterium fluoranthenivorans]QNJ93032.1 hypothetical protein HZU40_01160 [Mycolicibacterium fluoranthenivorans]SCX28591.1 hypothetical protein SAMN02799620_04582 [Mycolicibacterium fluoranthenivorans]
MINFVKAIGTPILAAGVLGAAALGLFGATGAVTGLEAAATAQSATGTAFHHQ